MLVNVFGKRGAGKTSLIKGQLKYCKAPVVIIDILGNFNSDEYLKTTSLSECLLILGEIHGKRTENQNIVTLQTSDPNLAVDFLSSALWELGGGTLVLDEVDSMEFSDSPCFDQLIRYGRNRGVDILTGCRRPAEISRNITAGANRFYIFGTHEPRDLDYFRTTILGDKAETLMRLEKYCGVFIDYDKNLVGNFLIDIDGNIFHTEEVIV